MTARVAGKLLIAGAAAWVALLAPFSILGTVNLALVYALVAVSLVILTGWVGQISLAQAAFVGLGAFSTGMVIRSYGLDFPLTIVVGAVVGAAAAGGLGMVALRVRGLFLAVATLIFAWAAQAYLFNLPWLAGSGGSSIAPTPPLGEEGGVPYLNFGDRRTFYLLLLAVVTGVLLAAANLRDSKTGRAWFAVKGSEIAAASLGIDVIRTKLGAFALSGGIAGIAGALSMTHEGVASASQFSVQDSLFYLAVAVVGGLTSLPGALVSAGLFASLEEFSFRFEFLSGLLLIISAGLLAVVLLFFPAGLAGIPARVGQAGRALWRSAAATATRRVVGAGLRLAWVGLRFVLRGPSRMARTGTATPDAGAPDADAAVDNDVTATDTAEIAAVSVGQPLETDTPDTDTAESDGAGTDGAEADGSEARRGVAARLAALRPGKGRRADLRTLRRSPAPDALLASVAAAQVAEQPAVAAGLAYRPGVATKIDLPPRDDRELMLAGRGITVQFGGLTAVNDFELEVRRGEIVGLIGPNGAGKTTLFNALSGLNEPTTGTVELYGQDISRLAVHERARLGMGRTFQAIQLFPDRTVFDNLMVATHQRNPSGFFSNLAATPGAIGWELAAQDRVRQVIGLVGLEEVADRRTADLPFGVLRLVELARALVTGSPLVMLDEPASGLDDTETDQFMDLLLWVRQSLGVTMLLIEHDMRVVMSLADYVYVIDRGTQIASDVPRRIQRDPAVIAAYLGKPPDDDDDEDPDDLQPAVAVPSGDPGSTSEADLPASAAR